MYESTSHYLRPNFIQPTAVTPKSKSGESWDSVRKLL